MSPSGLSPAVAPTAPAAGDDASHVVSVDSRARLLTANQVVAEALRSWGLSERVRRLALPSLLYDQFDLEHMRISLVEDLEGRGSAAVAWEESGGLDARRGPRVTLLHGLYVTPRCQRRGLGTRLLERIAALSGARGSSGILLRAWHQSEPFFLARGFSPLDPAEPPDLYPRRLWRGLQ